ncbi:hypothetical protein glysoja_008200, partial [Glycine soja]
AEVIVVIIAMETAKDKSWHNIWLECYSVLVIQAFKNVFLISWPLRRYRLTCFSFCNHITFVYSHVYREGNSCIDKLVNFGITFKFYSFGWNSIPDIVRDDFLGNRFFLLNYRF